MKSGTNKVHRAPVQLRILEVLLPLEKEEGSLGAQHGAGARGPAAAVTVVAMSGVNLCKQLMRASGLGEDPSPKRYSSVVGQIKHPYHLRLSRWDASAPDLTLLLKCL